jgi:phosphoribosylformimino-5-aminoimidazole carboxamide ribotide isomerase
MQVIPVIDLKAGVVVHARAGKREHYAPIRSQLCADSSPLTIVRALLEVHPFATLYVADLDAIEGRGDQAALIAAIVRAFPGLTLWVDCGLGDARSCRTSWACDLATPVIGTEALLDADALREVADERGRENWVLSLDYLDSGRAHSRTGFDPASMIETWPSRVIVMSLRRVGSAMGPDFDRLDEIRAHAGDREVIAAGGVRGDEDLRALAERGVSGVLVATALHAGRLSRAGIAAVASGPA